MKEEFLRRGSHGFFSENQFVRENVTLQLYCVCSEEKVFVHDGAERGLLLPPGQQKEEQQELKRQKRVGISKKKKEKKKRKWKWKKKEKKEEGEEEVEMEEK